MEVVVTVTAIDRTRRRLKFDTVLKVGGRGHTSGDAETLGPDLWLNRVPCSERHHPLPWHWPRERMMRISALQKRQRWRRILLPEQAGGACRTSPAAREACGRRENFALAVIRCSGFRRHRRQHGSLSLTA